MCGNDLVPKIPKDKPGSNLWRGICQNWNKVESNIVWHMGNEANINCWRDNWIPYVGKLAGTMLHNPSVVEAAMHVKDLVNDQGEWSVERLSNLVS